ncbi:MAG: hypothetical protein DI535_25390 [Citrobacter freundii]|nr:MAG: hypothetical protein DI535_25390 [Citrobacter freundii]
MLNEQHTQNEHVIAQELDDLKQIELQAYENAVKKARNALYVTAALIFIWEMIGMFSQGGSFDPVIVGIAAVISGIFVALALWTKKKPYTALIVGLCAFIGYIALVVFANGMVEGSAGVAKGLISGIFIKIIIIVNLVRPLKEAKELQAARQ